jgi:hypothetical protein
VDAVVVMTLLLKMITKMSSLRLLAVELLRLVYKVFGEEKIK